MKYVFEDKSATPICVVKDTFYMDYWSGTIFTGDIKDYIEKKIKKKEFTIIDTDIIIYELKDKDELIGYLFIMNRLHNYLDKNKQPFKEEPLHFIKKQLIKGKLKKEILWGEDNE